MSKSFGSVHAVSDLASAAVALMLAWIGALFAAGAAMLQARDVE